MKKTSLFIVFATSSFLLSDISEYVTSTDINSISFVSSENYAKLVSMPISEKKKIVSSIEAINKLGLEKIFIQNMAKNNFGGDDVLLQVQMFDILQNFNPELANYFDIVALENRPQLACINEIANEEMLMQQAVDLKREQARLIRTIEIDFNHALENLYLIKKEIDEKNILIDISKFPPPFDKISFWNAENIEKKLSNQLIRELNTVSNLVKPNLFLDISILEKPLSTYFFQNARLELIKVSTPSNQPLASNKKEQFSFSEILPYFYEVSELEAMNKQNKRLLEDILGMNSNYFKINDQIPLFNLEQEKDQSNLSRERESPKKISDADYCKKNFEYILKLQRDIALLAIRAEIFSNILNEIKDIESDQLDLYRSLPPLAFRILDAIQQKLEIDNSYLYGFDDYQVLLSSATKFSDDFQNRKINSFDLTVSLSKFLEKLTSSKNKVKISKNNITVNGEIISADILHIGDLSYFKSSDNKLYGYFNKGQWNILEQYRDYVEEAFETFEINKELNIESIIIPAPIEYVSAIKKYFESSSNQDNFIYQQRYENDVSDKFDSKVILERKYSYCDNIYEVAKNSFNQNSIYGRQQRSNDVVLQMYERVESGKNIDQISKIAELAAKGYDFSDLDSMSYVATKSHSLSAINRLANLAWSNSYMDRYGVMSEHNFASTIEIICDHGEEFRKFIN